LQYSKSLRVAHQRESSFANGYDGLGKGELSSGANYQSWGGVLLGGVLMPALRLVFPLFYRRLHFHLASLEKMCYDLRLCFQPFLRCTCGTVEPSSQNKARFSFGILALAPAVLRMNLVNLMNDLVPVVSCAWTGPDMGLVQLSVG
jgi:hypothetical protein